jgi:chromosome segregation ATPase
MPELVVRDATGQVETVAYHELPAMLLNELQKQQAQIVDQATTIQAQQSQIKSRDARIAALEAGSGTQQTQFADQARTIQAQLQTLTARLAALEKAMAATR